jgi:hypothetical protein
MDKEETLEHLREADDVHISRERFDYLTEEIDLYWRRALALTLAENGFSHSGVAKKLDVTDSTAKGYFDDLEEQFSQEALHTHPKQNPNKELWVDGYRNPYE